MTTKYIFFTGGVVSSVGKGVTAATIGLLLTLILYPVAVILGFVSIINGKVAIIAGILGLACWIGTLVYLVQFDAISYTGNGIYMGIVGATVTASAYFLRPPQALTQIADKTAAPTPYSGNNKGNAQQK